MVLHDRPVPSHELRTLPCRPVGVEQGALNPASHKGEQNADTVAGARPDEATLADWQLMETNANIVADYAPLAVRYRCRSKEQEKRKGSVLSTRRDGRGEAPPNSRAGRPCHACNCKAVRRRPGRAALPLEHPRSSGTHPCEGLEHPVSSAINIVIADTSIRVLLLPPPSWLPVFPCPLAAANAALLPPPRGTADPSPSS